MNPQHLIFLTAALTLATPFARAAVVTGNDLVRIEVRVQSDQDRKDLAKTTTDTVTQHKTLLITLSGKAKSPETRTGKWTAYGRSLKGNDITVLQSGEFKVSLADGVQHIGTRTKGKKVDATGTKYVGYSVVVKDGEKVVGEAAEPMGIAKEAAK